MKASLLRCLSWYVSPLPVVDNKKASADASHSFIQFAANSTVPIFSIIRHSASVRQPNANPLDVGVQMVVLVGHV